MDTSRNQTIGLAVISVLVLLSCSCTPEMKKTRALQQGESRFKAGDYDGAKIEYLKVLRLDAGNAVAYARCGAMWADEGVPLRAGAFLIKAKELAPKDLDNRYKLARVYVRIGQPQEAFKEAAEILKQAPDNGPALDLLVETAVTPEQVQTAEQEVAKFPHPESPHADVANAALAMRKGDLDKAEASLHHALSTDPRCLEAHVAMAVVAMAQKNDARAEEELKEAAELAPARSHERLNYAEFMIRKGKTEEARKYLQGLTTQARDFVAAWVLQAKIAQAERKYDEVTSLLQNVFSRDPDNIDARVTQAQALIGKGDIKQGTGILENVDKTYANNAGVKYQLALAYVQAKNPNLAVDELEQAINIAPKYVDAIILLAQLRIRAGDPKSVIAPLESALKLRPDLIQIKTLLADAYQAVGRSDDSTALFREQVQQTPDNAQSYMLLGIVLRRQNKNDEARKAFEKALELDPENAVANDQLADLDLQAKDFAAVHRRADALLQKHPQSAAAYYIHGRSYVMEKNFPAAEDALKKAIEIDPNLAVAYNLLVSIYVQTNRLAEALKQIDAVLAKNPQYAPALLTAGIIYTQMGDFAKARNSYEKALAVDPNFIPALNNLAYIYSEKLSNLGRAAELARKAHDLSPAEPSIIDTYGWVLYRQGKYQEAADLLAQSAAKAPDNAEIQYHLGMADYMMGRLDEARTALEKAVASSRDFPGKDEAKNRLDLLSQGGSSLSVADLEKVAKEKPNDPIASTRLAAAYAKEGNAAKAAETYERALQANPKLVDAALALAQLNAGPLKNNTKALEYARKARALAPGDPHVTATLGHIAYQASNFSWAYSLLQEASRALPDDPAVVGDFAWAAYATGKTKEAQDAMRRVSSGPAGQDHTDAALFLSMTPLDSNDTIPSGAENEVSKALAAQPDYVPALMAKAAIELQKGQTAEATAVYNNILQKWPDFAPAQKRLASIYANDPNNAGKGYELANKARRTLTDDPELARTLGILSFQRKEYARAIQLLQESEGKKSLDGKSLFALGMAHLQLGHKTDAKKDLDRALAAGIPDDLTKQAKEAIAALDKPQKG